MKTAEQGGPLSLRARDLPVLARIAVLWPAAAVLKRSVPVPRLAGLFGAAPRLGPGRGGPRRGGAVPPWRLARLIDGVLRRAYRHRPGYCVERSLLLFHLLRRGGHPARLCFGVVRAPEGRLAGHAWVTLDGEPVAEPVDPRTLYATTYASPEDARRAG